MSASPQPTSMGTSSSSSGSTFSPSSSPPLILAFLAIGLFSAALVFIFWRRIQGNRNWRLNATPLDIDRSLYFNLSNINVVAPKLWDLSNGGIFLRGQGEKEGASPSDVTWVNLMVHMNIFFPQDFHYETKKPSWANLHISLYLYPKK